MTPPQLAKSNTEHGHQRALFAWANMALLHGFAAAWSEEAYVGQFTGPSEPVVELEWFHAIPNGGLRDKRTASMLKAEGVKKGIPDTLLPLPMFGMLNAEPPVRGMIYAGLYVEMKRPESEEQGRKGVASKEQERCIAWLRHSGYAVSVCFDWEAAAREVQSYIEASRKGAVPRN